ncbi:hypothetical protein KO500_09985 [Cellulophaga baltica]|uniref:hypothetical protein n=1 Tax=Cellulophaga TaxID=104264 RepID=UPI001C073989|nr:MULTISPECIES: hypothetical protein [Cellulophaga]MBU2996766.1 hypothetical protein [Cellulophaga baltica]MDO6768162.1 hypothetical protein [Cellulophaga sp. 1_MG-2023]
MTKIHSFHIPVMGIGFTIDSPLKVAHFGIDSVISLVDDILLEKLRKMYCQKFEQSYDEISEKIDDFRAKRITSYLDLIHNLAHKNIEKLKNTTATSEIVKYFSMLPDSLSVKREFNKLINDGLGFEDIKDWLKENIHLGSIDVNIMTKVDKENYANKEKLPSTYNDAHAALRGFANSKLSSSVILSAGMNPRLYSYMENFKDFYPDEYGYIKKKIVLKVSDYRSALIQGKFLAKKGLWVSEYRIESGLNCGGHAFATDGYLMGPILEQFKTEKENLIQTTHQVFIKALEQKKIALPKTTLPIKITAQGGVGTAEEHNFLLDYYKVDSVGWGTPFLLVPEATTVDNKTLDSLIKAKEEDLYLSNISPLGIPFHNLKGNTKDDEKFKNIAKGRPGSACPKKFVALNKEFKTSGVCTASREYQHLKIKELEALNLSKEKHAYHLNKIIEKSCTCVGLGTSALIAYGLDTKTEGSGVSVCPGPNMAYYDKSLDLATMINHIYGKTNVISRTDRPNMFIKELNIYIEYLYNYCKDLEVTTSKKQEKYALTFAHNLREGIGYYQNLFNDNTFIKKQLSDALILLKEIELNINTFELNTAS